MAKVGAPQTVKFEIGTAELRVGPAGSAMKLTQAHSIGLVDNVVVDVNQNSVDLLGGFPRVPVDTAIVSQEAQVTGTMREYSRRNLQILLGESVPASQPADLETTLTADATQGAVALTVTSETGFVSGDLVLVFEPGKEEELTLARVDTVAATTITLDADTPLLFACSGTTVASKVVLAHPVPIGAITQTNYFAVQLVSLERATGRPNGWHFWKCAVGAGLSVASNAEDFASTDMVLKALQPAASEYGASATYEYLNDVIPQHPTGLRYGGGDA